MYIPQSDGYSETQFHKEILHILLVVAALQTIQALEEEKEMGGGRVGREGGEGGRERGRKGGREGGKGEGGREKSRMKGRSHQ